MIHDRELATIYRKKEIEDWNFKKSWWNITGCKYYWHLTFQIINDNIDIQWIGKNFQFNTDISADIVEWDRLKICDDTYDVMWVAKQWWISFGRLICNLKKW